MRSKLSFIIGAFAAVLAAAFANVAHASDCSALSGTSVAASVIALPSKGAQVLQAQPVPPTGKLPAFCKILAAIAPVDPRAPLINVEINLPSDWNGKAVQYGGGGLNGTLVTGLDALRDAPPSTPTPLAQGFATFGTDAGHQTTAGQDLQSFAANDEALVNHAYGAYKKTHDLAVAVIKTFYGRTPRRLYFFGGSEGGREAMSSVQRFPADYDGAVATVPVLSWMGTNIAAYRQWQALMDGGWLSPVKVQLVSQVSLKACDASDGIADGVITRYRGCDAKAATRSVLCPGGSDTGDDCLSEKQVRLVETVRTPIRYGYALADGSENFPAYPTGGEANPGAYIPYIVPPKKPDDADSGATVYAVGDIRYFVVGDPNFRAPLDLAKYKSRIQYISSLMDMTNPDLTAFKAHGGKLIMKENGGDYLVAPQGAFRYYERLVQTMGKAQADAFVKLYVAPFTTHGGQGRFPDASPVPDKIDLLSLLDAWVEKASAPADVLTLSSYVAGQPSRTWPLCRYPLYPRYRGAGDAREAGAYRCTAVGAP